MAQQIKSEADTRRSRITVDLSHAEYEMLRRLRRATGISYANLCRFGISILNEILTTTSTGGRVTFRRGEITSDVLIPFPVDGRVLQAQGV